MFEENLSLFSLKKYVDGTDILNSLHLTPSLFYVSNINCFAPLFHC